MFVPGVVVAAIPVAVALLSPVTPKFAPDAAGDVTPATTEVPPTTLPTALPTGTRLTAGEMN
jgi:hypothetical protein